MSVPSNENMAHLAISIAHEIWEPYGWCWHCGKNGFELHEILGREMRPILGVATCILGSTLYPLCKQCHEEIEELTTEQQVINLTNHSYGTIPMRAIRDQIVAIKARWNKA